ncbi:MAG: hypothetical protein KAS75_01085 [Planctomycetes bacterium]|nr:hypothetical protein [Planctomycetota bacterium]
MINFAHKLLFRIPFCRRYLLPKFKAFIQRRFPVWFLRHQLQRSAQINPYADDTQYGFYEGTSVYTLGIIKELTHFHHHYIAACRELDVSYKVLDISVSNWIDVINKCQCDAFLIWPSAMMTIYKQMYDERLRVMVRDMGKIIFPSYDELWMWESKRRMRDWLVAHQIPNPETWIFYDYDQAHSFIKTASLPIVFKTDHGDSAKGVKIIRTQTEANRILKQVFSIGYRLEGSHRCDLQWGSAIFQQYIPDAVEWRIIRVGNSYFGYMKKQYGDYASGFGDAVYGDPPVKLLNLMRDLTEANNFRSMSIDVLIGGDGQIYVTELQSLFGDTVEHRKLIIDGKPGRYLYNKAKKSWEFQEGIFDQNVCCNLRVEYVIKMLEEQRV